MTPGSTQGRFRGRRKGSSTRSKRWVGILAVLVVFLLIVFNRHGLFRLYQLRSEQKHIEAGIALLQEQAVELRREEASLESDLAYIERLAREKYRMVRRGEKVFRVIRDQPNSKRGE